VPGSAAPNSKLDGQVFWLSAPRGPARLPAVRPAVAWWAGPGRSQRRPRAGFAPASLFIPRPERTGGNLSSDRYGIRRGASRPAGNRGPSKPGFWLRSRAS